MMASGSPEWSVVDMLRVAHGAYHRATNKEGFYLLRAGLIVGTSYRPTHTRGDATAFRVNADGTVVRFRESGSVASAWVVPFGQSARSIFTEE